MRLLLDTHTFLWFVLKDSRLSRLADGLIVDPLNDIHISPASYWEIAIKVGKKKLDLLASYDDFMKQGIVGNDFTILPIETKHTSSLTTMATHHKDPFDRLIIAQALVERIPVISEDTAFDHYGVARLW
jgi:PIN domain nuclease of toxin-antitoxin system